MDSLSIENEIKQHRDTSLDAVCGLLIIYMILCHAFGWSGTTEDSFYRCISRVLFFFMPWFFYKSGMFYTRSDAKSIMYSSKKLIFPYLFYSIVGELVRWYDLFFIKGKVDVVDYVLSPLKSLCMFGAIQSNAPLWFLLSLFFTKVVVSLSDRFNVSKIWLLLFSIVIFGFGSMLNEYRIPCWLFSTAGGIAFFVMGYMLKQKQHEHKVFILSFIVFVLCVAMLPSNVDFRVDVVTDGYWIVYFISSLAGIIVFNNIFRLDLLKFPALTSIGRNSLSYYCLHWILFNIVVVLYNFKPYSSPDYLILFTLITYSIVILPVIAHFTNFIKKKYPCIGVYL